MATQLWLRNSTPPAITVTGYAFLRDLGTSVGSGVSRLGSGTPTTSGNHIEIVNGGNTYMWLYRVGAVTISASIAVSWCGLENAMTDNVQPAVRIVRLDNTGTILSDVVANANANHASGVEFGTANARQTWTITTPTSTAFSDGDWLGVIGHGDAIGTMAAGSAASWLAFENTAAALGDTNLTFTDTIPAYVASAPSIPYLNPMPPFLAQ